MVDDVSGEPIGEPGAGARISDWLDKGVVLHDDFVAAQPFPMVVIDGFLDEDLAWELHDQFPSVEAMKQSRDYVFGDKKELSSVAKQGPAARRFASGALSPEFARFLSDVAGVNLFVDPTFHGGGFHQGGDGSFLDTHVDFNVHPLHDDWLRTLNVLLYLCPDWPEHYGGHLLVQSSPDEAPRAILPAFNRAVIMLTANNTFHGYRRMSLPPGVTRKSIATYAYQVIEPGSVASHTTGWAPEKAGPAKRLLAKNYDRLVHVKNRFFGSGTARNR